MGKEVKCNERNKEIVNFFYTIFGSRIRKGLNQEEARKEAYDAVGLRYGRERKTVLNIISALKSSRSVNRASFEEKTRALITEIDVMNEELEATKVKNNKLIGLLKECLDCGS